MKACDLYFLQFAGPKPKYIYKNVDLRPKYEEYDKHQTRDTSCKATYPTHLPKLSHCLDVEYETQSQEAPRVQLGVNHILSLMNLCNAAA